MQGNLYGLYSQIFLMLSLKPAKYLKLSKQDILPLSTKKEKILNRSTITEVSL